MTLLNPSAPSGTGQWPRFEYIAPVGEYGKLEETLNFYGDLGWETVTIDLHFRANEGSNWCAVLKRAKWPNT